MSIYDIDKTVNMVVSKGKRGYGQFPKPRMDKMTPRPKVGKVVSPEDVIRTIEMVLDKIPEVQQAVGQLTVKVAGKTPKTLSFRYG